MEDKQCQFCVRYPGDDSICSYTLDVVTYNTNPTECVFYTISKSNKQKEETK